MPPSPSPPSVPPTPRQEAEDLGALVAGLFSPLAHDLRAGLNGISVWTHLLGRNADEVSARALEGIRRAVGQQSTLAQDLSQFGAALNAQRGQAAAPVDVAALCEAAAAEARTAHPGHDVSVQVEAVPEIESHAALLQMVVRLLLLDILAAVPEGTMTSLSLRETEAALAVEIWAAPRDSATSAPRRATLRQALAALATCMLGGHLDVQAVDGSQRAHLQLSRPAPACGA
jgi:signal transduction histidine kinase